MKEFLPYSPSLENKTYVQVLGNNRTYVQVLGENQTILQREFTSLAVDNLTYLQKEFIAKPDLPPWVSKTVELDPFCYFVLCLYIF